MAPKAKAAKPAKKATKAPAKKTGEKKESMASVAYELIKAGKTNTEVRDILRKKFSLPAEHDYYPSWYRSKLVQTNQITKKFAEDHSGEPAKEEKPKKAKKPSVTSAPKSKKAAKDAGLATASEG